MPENDDAQYEVGYGKPPRETRFQKGVSGNRRGRPRGSKNLATIVLRESRKKVQVNGPSGTGTVTKLEAAVMQLGNKSAQGDPRASREFLSLVKRSEESEENAASGAESTRVSELDKQLMESLRSRFAKTPSDSDDSQKGSE